MPRLDVLAPLRHGLVLDAQLDSAQLLAPLAQRHLHHLPCPALQQLHSWGVGGMPEQPQSQSYSAQHVAAFDSLGWLRRLNLHARLAAPAGTGTLKYLPSTRLPAHLPQVNVASPHQVIHAAAQPPVHLHVQGGGCGPLVLKVQLLDPLAGGHPGLRAGREGQRGRADQTGLASLGAATAALPQAQRSNVTAPQQTFSTLASAVFCCGWPGTSTTQKAGSEGSSAWTPWPPALDTVTRRWCLPSAIVRLLCRKSAPADTAPA